MELAPRYRASPVVAMIDEPEAVGVSLLRQRRRLDALLQDLAPDEWHRASRCDAWTVKDVLAHLVGVNNYWTFSIEAGLAGNPSQALAQFDPVAVPAAMVAAAQATPVDELLDQFRASNQRLIDVVERLDAADWDRLAECPLGHVSIAVVAHHALWDFLIHEWDIAVPLQRERIAEPDEVLASLAYAAALNGALLTLGDMARPGVVAIETTDPSAIFVLELTDSVTVRRVEATSDVPCLRGDAVALLEAVSVREPIPPSTPDAWLTVLAGLRETFDQPFAM